uniref:Metalloendopeptidase n=1 Tax=Culicoides sonorensis TaxID=179676 RepID=Q5QBK3_CULSO|nr:astacin-type metalloprotease [Culicoides sonorensis]
MIKFGLKLVIFALIGSSFAFPSPKIAYDAEELAGKFEGDIELTPEQIRAMKQRNGLLLVTKRWNNNTVDYIITGNYSQEQKNYIRKGLDTLQLVTCLKFIGHDNATGLTDYVEVVSSGGGCSSTVGRKGGRQTLNLQSYPVEEGCFRLATIMHEFIHALGFYHMQSTYNRDEYVDVKYENIEPGKENNFNKYTEDTVTDYGIEYDYNSVMHYGRTGFSINGEPTLVPIKDPEAKIGQRVGLSRRDIEKLNKMYDCPL